jgi:hypothetical protein
MATYKHANYLQPTHSEDFDTDYSPGVPAPYAGIYRCMGCHREIAIALGHFLPPEEDHAHVSQQGDIRWRMIVHADHNPK